MLFSTIFRKKSIKIETGVNFLNQIFFNNFIFQAFQKSFLSISFCYFSIHLKYGIFVRRNQIQAWFFDFIIFFIIFIFYFLALIGNGLEEVSLISELLNVEKYPRRPAYKFANPDGLILVDCNYEGLNWISGKSIKFSADKVNKRLYSMKIALGVQERIKVNLHNFPFLKLIKFRKNHREICLIDTCDEKLPNKQKSV